MLNRWRNSFIVAAIFGIPAMVIMLVFMFKYKDHMTAPQVTIGLSVENLIMFLLATPVQVRRTFFVFMLERIISYR
jgi:Cu+-exporting ATPase